MRNSSLWSNLVFEKEVVSRSNIKTPQALSPFSSESTQCCAKRVFFFLSLFSCNFDDQLSPNFPQLCYLVHMLGYIKWDCLVPVRLACIRPLRMETSQACEHVLICLSFFVFCRNFVKKKSMFVWYVFFHSHGKTSQIKHRNVFKLVSSSSMFVIFCLSECC